jgi:uncharacterized phage-associated protein
MTTAKAILDAIEIRKPGLSEHRKHNLLFFAQGHYLATHGTALFAEPFHATNAGVTVDLDGEGDDATPTSKQLGMLGWVLHRYSEIWAVDLRTLIQASTPWQLARSRGQDARIEWAWLTEWFRRPDERDGEGLPGGDVLAAAEARLRASLGG